MGQFLFAFLIMLVVFFGWTLLVIRLGLDVYEVRKGRIWYYLASSVITGIFITGFIGGNMIESVIFVWCYRIGAWWFGALMITGLIMIPIWIIRRWYKNPFPVWAMILSAVLVAGANLWGVIAALTPTITHFTLNIDGEHQWHGKDIVLISDMHYGNIWGAGSAQKLVENINHLDPEVVLVAGDMFDGPKIDYDSIIQILGGIQAPQGIIFIKGNHEEYRHTEEIHDALSRSQNITFLENDQVTLSGITFAGVGYLDTSTASGLTEVLDSLTLQSSTILLKHAPRFHNIIEEYPIDLVVSGHTHHGQMWPLSLITDALYGAYSYGLVEGEKLPYAITTSGVGTWGPPQRLGTHSEIVVIHIQ